MPNAPDILWISSRALPRAAELADAAGAKNYRVTYETPRPPPGNHLFYGGTDVALSAAALLKIALIEPPLDLLSRLPPEFLLRRVAFARYIDLPRIPGEWFAKPADPLAKLFDAGVHRSLAAMNHRRPIPAETPVLLSEPVEWSAEYRIWILNRRVATTSAYLSMGRPLHHAPNARGLTDPRSVTAFADRLLALNIDFPPAFVVDVGLIDNRGWAVVEFNPACNSGVLGGDIPAILTTIQRACIPHAAISAADRPFILRR